MAQGIWNAEGAMRAPPWRELRDRVCTAYHKLRKWTLECAEPTGPEPFQFSVVKDQVLNFSFNISWSNTFIK